MLEINKLISGFRKGNPVIKNISFRMDAGETVAVIGHNGAGKSTLAKSIVNMVPYLSGEIKFRGESIIGLKSYQIIEKDIQYFLQGGRVFSHLTIEEHINFVGSHLSKEVMRKRRDKIFNYFPLFQHIDNGRLKLQASYLSGGEQHQLSLAMTLMKSPVLLILDEPSAGLSPDNIKQLYQILQRIKAEEEELSILLIEQNVRQAKKFANRIIILENGEIVLNKNVGETSYDQIEKFFFRS